MSQKYVYLAVDLLTGTVREEIPFSSVSFSQVINGSSNFSGDVIIREPNNETDNKITMSNLGLGDTAIWVLHNGVPRWGGILWDDDISLDDRRVSFMASDFWSYYMKRILNVDLSYSNTDALTIVSNLITWSNGIAGGDIGTTVGGSSTSVNRTRTYKGKELHKISELIRKLAELEDGFDFAIDYSGSQETGLDHQLTLSYPSRGRDNGLVFDAGKNVSMLSSQGSAWEMINRSHAHNSSDDAKLIRSRSNPGALSAYPLYERTFPHNGVIRPETMLDHARIDLQNHSIVTRKVTVQIDASDPEIGLGTFIAGDTATVIGKLGYLDINRKYRIVGYTVDVDEDQLDTMTVELVDSRLF